MVRNEAGTRLALRRPCKHKKSTRGTPYSTGYWPSILQACQIYDERNEEDEAWKQARERIFCRPPPQSAPTTVIPEKHQNYPVMCCLFFGHFSGFFVRVYSAPCPAVYRNNPIVSTLLSCFQLSIRETFENTSLSPLETSQPLLTS